jgi:hypothetical protein
MELFIALVATAHLTTRYSVMTEVPFWTILALKYA